MQGEYEDDFHNDTPIGDDSPATQASSPSPRGLGPEGWRSSNSSSTNTLSTSCLTNYTHSMMHEVTQATPQKTNEEVSDNGAIGGSCEVTDLGALALGISDGGLGGNDKPADSKAANAVRVEWESLADDLLLEDWHTSGYYSDDFEAEGDDVDAHSDHDAS